MILVAALLVAAAPPGPVGHICWIDRVFVEGTGVRILFDDTVPLPPAQKTVHAGLGQVLDPQTSGHDGCRVTVARRGGRIGVEAQSHFFAYGITPEPEIRHEWFPAIPAR